MLNLTIYLEYMFRIIGFICLMLNRFIYILLFISFLLPYDNKWATTRFEQWWSEKFSSMIYREPLQQVMVIILAILMIWNIGRELTSKLIF